MVRAIIVADGDLPAGDAGLHLLLAPDEDGAPIVIAADGGARKAVELGLSPDLVIGDGDSLTAAEIAQFSARGADVLLFPPEKDESDTELALREAVARGARRIVIVGALGGERIDHGLANVALLALPEGEGRDVALTDGRAIVRLVGRPDGPGELRIVGQPHDLVSLLPLDPAVEGVRTTGLRYPLHGEALRLGTSRGLSNELVENEARVNTRTGRLLVVHTPLPTKGKAPPSSRRST